MPVTCQFYWSRILSKLIGTVSHYWCLNRISRNQKMRGEYKNLEKSVWIALGGAQYYTKTSQDYRSMIYCSHEVSIWAKSGFFGTHMDSSISTVFPRPPSLTLPCRIFREQMSRSLWSAVTAVRSDKPVSSDTFLLDSSIDHKKMMYSHCDSGILESSKKEPALIDLRFLHLLTGHSQW